MKILSGYRNARKKLISPALAIGIFDGVHLGHKKVLSAMLSSKGTGDKAVLTFDPHPVAFLDRRKVPPRIMSLEHRLRIFEREGMTATVIVSFTDHIASMPPEDFIEKVISKGTGARKIFVGEGFVFGRKASGSTDELSRICREKGIEVVIVPPLKRKGSVVSSTRIRALITEGKLKDAETLLGKPVSVLGTVVPGRGIGKALDAPTANIDPHHEVIPPPGVYAANVDVKGKLLPAVVNIGYKPTFYGQNPKRKEPSIEVHIIGFKGRLYGSDIEISFIRKLREEKQFSSPEKLAAQIKKDIKKAQETVEGKKVKVA